MEPMGYFGRLMGFAVRPEGKAVLLCLIIHALDVAQALFLMDVEAWHERVF
jgi:hypothetical protein